MTWAFFGKLFSSGKGAAFLASLLAGIGGFSLGELTGYHWLSVALFGFCAVAVAFIKARPHVITAEAAAEVNRRAQFEAETAALIARIHETEATTRKFLEDRIVQQNKLLSLMTITEHAILNETQRLTTHIDELEWILREHGIEFPNFLPTDLARLTREEDEVRAEIIGIPLPEKSA